jgi:hypothetical protein
MKRPAHEKVSTQSLPAKFSSWQNFQYFSRKACLYSLMHSGLEGGGGVRARDSRVDRAERFNIDNLLDPSPVLDIGIRYVKYK